MVNKVILIGNLGKDPEIRYTQAGTPVATFSIACNERWRDKSGDQQERVEWVRIVAWGKLAEICEKYLEKGKQVYIEGRLQTRSWEDSDGVKRWMTEVVAREMKMLGQKGSSTGRRPEPPEAAYDDYEDDIPF